MKKVGGGHKELMVPITDSIFHYSKMMGGVDLSDQLLQYFQTRRQTHKYWKTLFYHCVDIAVTNAYLLHRQSLSQAQRSKNDHKNFVSSLVRQLTQTTCTIHSP